MVKQAFRQIQKACFIELTGKINSNPILIIGLFLEQIEPDLQKTASFCVKNFYSGNEFTQLFGENSSDNDIEKSFSDVFRGCKGSAIVSLAYTSDGIDVHIFEGELEGTVVTPKGDSGNAWEYHFLIQNVFFFLITIHEFGSPVVTQKLYLK
jgi:hypothetical protein